jgi:phosphohistidine phosphatase
MLDAKCEVIIMENKPIHLYLVRHGTAKDSAEDPERPLTENGRRIVEKTASFVARQHPPVDQIRHSGKKRAEQTAEIFAQYLSPSKGTVAIPGLAPNDDIEATAEIVQHENGAIMLVGHLPFLSRLTSRLLLNNSEKHIFSISPSSVLSLSRSGTLWKLDWMLNPDQLSTE